MDIQFGGTIPQSCAEKAQRFAKKIINPVEASKHFDMALRTFYSKDFVKLCAP